MSEARNNVGMLRNYFAEIVPVSLAEFKVFWDSLTDKEKDYYRLVDLKTGLITWS